MRVREAKAALETKPKDIRNAVNDLMRLKPLDETSVHRVAQAVEENRELREILRPILLQVMKRSTPSVRGTIAYALQHYSKDERNIKTDEDRKAIGEVIGALDRAMQHDRNADVRATAAMSLSAFQDHNTTEKLVSAFAREKHPDVTESLIEALGARKHAAARDALIAGFKPDAFPRNGNSKVGRHEVIRLNALATHPMDSARTPIIEGLKRNPGLAYYLNERARSKVRDALLKGQNKGLPIDEPVLQAIAEAGHLSGGEFWDHQKTRAAFAFNKGAEPANARRPNKPKITPP